MPEPLARRAPRHRQEVTWSPASSRTRLGAVNGSFGSTASISADHGRRQMSVLPPSAPLMEALGTIKAAAAAAPGEWQQWYWICIGGVAVFIATIFLMRGRWSPAVYKPTKRHTTPPWHASCTP